MRSQKAAERLRQLGAAHAWRITPTQVVEEARDPASPLHDEFIWDNDKAAEMQRLDHARTLIRAVRLVVHTESTQVSSVFFVRDPGMPAREQGYIAVPALRGTPAAQSALRQEFQRAAAALGRAQEIAVGLDLVADIAPLLEELLGLVQRVDRAA